MQKQFRRHPETKVERKYRNLARSGEALAGLRGACACSETAALREVGQNRMAGRYQQDGCDLERMHAQQHGVGGHTCGTLLGKPWDNCVGLC